MKPEQQWQICLLVLVRSQGLVGEGAPAAFQTSVGICGSKVAERTTKQRWYQKWAEAGEGSSSMIPSPAPNLSEGMTFPEFGLVGGVGGMVAI